LKRRGGGPEPSAEPCIQHHRATCRHQASHRCPAAHRVRRGEQVQSAPQPSGRECSLPPSERAGRWWDALRNRAEHGHHSDSGMSRAWRRNARRSSSSRELSGSAAGTIVVASVVSTEAAHGVASAVVGFKMAKRRSVSSRKTTGKRAAKSLRLNEGFSLDELGDHVNSAARARRRRVKLTRRSDAEGHTWTRRRPTQAKPSCAPPMMPSPSSTE
jgi:hypothetical protein